MFSNNNIILINFQWFYIYPFFISFTSAVILIPIINRLGRKFNLFDFPDERKIHKKPLIRIGGLAICISFLIGTFAPYLINNINIGFNIVIILIGSLLFFIIGFIDDLFNLSPFLKLFLQIIIASILFNNGVSINAIDFSLFSNEINFSKEISYLLTLFWIVGLTNAFNWIDGLDGLATGITIISSTGFIIVSLLSGNIPILLALIALLGTCFGFLAFNFYPSKILMGDGGSYFLGSLIAISSILINYQISKSFLIVWPVFMLFYPIMDISIVTFSRIFKGKFPFYPDQSHLHHRLLKIGFSHRNSVFFIYMVSFIFSILALLLLFYFR